METTPQVQWTAKPADDPKKPKIPIDRCGAQSSMQYIVLSREVIGCMLHFFRGRSIPCLMPSEGWCDACTDPKGNEPRWRGYLCCWRVHFNTFHLLELTPPCMTTVASFIEGHEHLRGAIIRLERPSGKANGRIVCQLEKTNVRENTLPPAFDVRDALERIWALHKIVRVGTATPEEIAKQMNPELPLNFKQNGNGSTEKETT